MREPGEFEAPGSVLSSLETRLASIEENLWGPVDEKGNHYVEGSLEDRLRKHDDRFDTRNSSWWLRKWFRINGWPHWTVLADKPKWRPWHAAAQRKAERDLAAGRKPSGIGRLRP